MKAVLERILLDERRHLAWVGQALDGQRGACDVDALLGRFRRADTAASGIAEAELHAILEDA